MRYFIFLLIIISIISFNAQAGMLGRLLGKNTEKSSKTHENVINLAYGSDPLQSMDIFLPANPDHAPILMMVHGGGWKRGDKDGGGLTDNKGIYWGAKGYIFVKVNYRLAPQVDVYTEAQDVSRAIAKMQQIAQQYKADASRFILMGHSAGAHLVALVSANPSIAREQGAKPWSATVVLDSGAVDVASIMKRRHARLYDMPFGKDPAFWSKVSPIENIQADAIAMLVVCSSKRADDSCGQARSFANKLKSMGHDTQVMPVELSHGGVTMELGKTNQYTEDVNQYMEQHLAVRKKLFQKP